MKHTRRSNLAGGFTLMELIIAMTMVAVLTGSLYSALSTASKAKTTADRAVAPVRAASIAADIISRDFESIVKPAPYFNQNSTPNYLTDELYFTNGPFFAQPQSSGTGAADMVQFFTNNSDGQPDGTPFVIGVRRVELMVRTDVTPPVLVRRVWRNVLSPNIDSLEPEEEVICRNVVSFSLQYHDGVSFYEDWDSTTMIDPANVLPVLVRMELIVGMDEPGQIYSQSNPQQQMTSILRMIRIPIGRPQEQQ